MAAEVHPEDWLQPTPSGTYNLVVVGGGTAGLIAALGAAGLGARVALVERRWLGGDCLVHGCVPSKALLAAAHAAHASRQAHAYGVLTGEVQVDFPEVMRRMRALRAEIAHHDAARRLAEAGVDVFLGEGRFTGPEQLEVRGVRLDFARAIVATGARALRPPIPGIDDIDVLDNEGVFELTELPPRLVVIGGGPIGCELGQAFARFGSQVTLVDQAPRVLNGDDADAAAIVANQLESEGIALRMSTKVVRFEPGPSGGARTVVERDGREEVLDSDAVLLAVGRAPNVDGMGLETAGVRFSRGGIEVDAYLQTTNPKIFASGDVASKFKFTHAADALSRVALQNALFFGFKKASDLVIPWATFTEPELAHVGIDQEEASRRPDVSIFEAPMSRNDRSLLEGETQGFARVYADNKGRILGATIVGRHAGELIGTVTVAMTQGLPLSALNDTILPYPTRTMVLKRLGGEYNRTRLTPLAATVLRTLLAWRR
ncbi:MAG: mercuric reductase [Deltaproteobacteria bacterium]|nr:MAG: mercuric reductase [Deltaproteobacteria bacterium]